MKAKITKANGTALDADTQVGPVNLFLHSLFSQDGNRLDLILTKTPDLVSDVEVLTDHFNSDHFPVGFNIKL